jgi:hypothetical protein
MAMATLSSLSENIRNASGQLFTYMEFTTGVEKYNAHNSEGHFENVLLNQLM